MYSPQATSPNYGIAVLEQLLCWRATVRIHVRSVFSYILFIYSVGDDSAVSERTLETGCLWVYTMNVFTKRKLFFFKKGEIVIQVEESFLIQQKQNWNVVSVCYDYPTALQILVIDLWSSTSLMLQLLIQFFML